MPSRYLTLEPAESNGHVQVLALPLPRSVDMYEYDRLNEEIATLTETGRSGRWVLDLSKSVYVGSAILGVMVNLRQRIRAGGGHMTICCLSDTLAEAMRTCSLYNLFSVGQTRADAVRLVKSLR
jgi:anti-anti-sigma factor